MNGLFLPEFDAERCTHCGRCAIVCPEGAFEVVGNVPLFTRPDLCTYCGACEVICPAGALALRYGIIWNEDKSK